MLELRVRVRIYQLAMCIDFESSPITHMMKLNLEEYGLWTWHQLEPKSFWFRIIIRVVSDLLHHIPKKLKHFRISSSLAIDIPHIINV